MRKRTSAACEGLVREGVDLRARLDRLVNRSDERVKIQTTNCGEWRLASQ